MLSIYKRLQFLGTSSPTPSTGASTLYSTEPQTSGPFCGSPEYATEVRAHLATTCYINIWRRPQRLPSTISTHHCRAVTR